MNANATAWDIDEDDFGGRLVRHRHLEASAIAYVYNRPDRAWAECSMCGAELGLVSQPRGVSERDEVFDPSVP